jgi:hypothetical protein
MKTIAIENGWMFLSSRPTSGGHIDQLGLLPEVVIAVMPCWADQAFENCRSSPTCKSLSRPDSVLIRFRAVAPAALILQTGDPANAAHHGISDETDYLYDGRFARPGTAQVGMGQRVLPLPGMARHPRPSRR